MPELDLRPQDNEGIGSSANSATKSASNGIAKPKKSAPAPNCHGRINGHAAKHKAASAGSPENGSSGSSTSPAASTSVAVEVADTNGNKTSTSQPGYVSTLKEGRGTAPVMPTLAAPTITELQSLGVVSTGFGEQQERKKLSSNVDTSNGVKSNTAIRGPERFKELVPPRTGKTIYLCPCLETRGS